LIKGKIFIISAATAALSLIAVIVILGFRISALSDQLNENQLMYNSELDNNKLLIDEISQNLHIISTSNNEVRRTLHLPAKQLIQSNNEESENESYDAAVSFFDAFRFLVENEDLENGAAEFSAFIDELGIDEYFTEKEYTFQRVELLEATVIKNDILYLTLFYDGSTKTVQFSDVIGNSFEVVMGDSTVISTLDREIQILKDYERNIHNMSVFLEEAGSKEDIQSILDDRGLSIRLSENNRYNIYNDKDDSIIGFFKQRNDKIYLNSIEYSDSGEFSGSLKEYLTTVSNRTEFEQIDDLVQIKMEEVFADEGFKVLLESNNCLPELTEREDEEFIYYDVFNLSGTVKGSFALQKEFGEVLLLTGDGKYLKSLNMFTPDNNFKSLIVNSEDENTYIPFLFDDSSENFLVVGTHEHNADTMIIVNANNKTGKLNMISFPRDLYYKGKKINNIYKVYGADRLCAELSEITGLDIKKYISIDMFAFVDVVNILGGLDVTLEEDLIDPTYKVKNNGVWSTLYYRKGTHHLDGVAALRIARSRHGSVAYDRSRRQQLIIKAIVDSMKSLDAGDMDKIYDFVSKVSSYIDTNLTIADIVKNFLMYKDNEIGEPNIINTDNILDAKWTNTYLLSAEDEDKALNDDDFYRGLWIVLPKNNNWNLIKKHIENILNDGI